MMRRLSFAFLVVLQAGCALQEEIILEEPIIADEIADITPTECDTGDDDGIGGTGCEPVARHWHSGGVR